MTLCRVYVYQWGTEFLLCVGINSAFGSALTTLIKKISADSGEWLGLWGEISEQMGLSSATIEENRVGFIFIV